MHEARELVAGEEGLLQRRVARKLQVLRMRQNGLDDLLWIPGLAQDRRSVLGVLVKRRMHLVVEVVEQRGDAPLLLVAAEFPRVGGGRRLDCERMTKERFALRVRRQRLPGLLPCRSHEAA